MIMQTDRAVINDLYTLALNWIVANRAAGQGAATPRDVAQISAWPLVRMVADVFGRDAADVARDVIEKYEINRQQGLS